MSTVIDTIKNLGETISNLIDYLVKDEKLSNEFENFLKENDIQIKKESELTDIIIEYILDGRLSDGTRVLDYYSKNVSNSNEGILNGLRNSFISVFKVNRIQKTHFETTDLISEKDFALIPLVKMMELRGIGLKDFIKARVVGIDNNYYTLEIHDIIGSLKEWDANKEAVNQIIKNPNTPILNNKDKFIEIKKITESFLASFKECFNKDEIILSNKDTDRILNDFYLFHTGKIDKISPFEEFKEENCKYTDIKEFEKDFLLNAYEGFNSTENTYDTGIYADFEFGIFVIPFLGTLNKILKENSIEKTENASKCILDFLKSQKTPINLIKKKSEEYANFVEIVNKSQNQNFKSIDEIISFYRPDYDEIKTKMNFSPIMVLYSSNVFSKLLNKKEDEKKTSVGRNDLCPCGSGKKYKKCCLIKE